MLECYWLSTCGMLPGELSDFETNVSIIVKSLQREKGQYAESLFKPLLVYKTKNSEFPKVNLKANAPKRVGKAKLNSYGWHSKENLPNKCKERFINDTIKRLKNLAIELSAK